MTFIELILKLDNEMGPAGKAASIAMAYGQIEGDHHKAWVIDQMLRLLLGNFYEEAVEIYNAPTGDSRGDNYFWDEGMTP